jgi:hypothetical protein
MMFTAVAPVRANDQAEGMKLVDAAIKAAGGADNLKKLETVILKGKGKITLNNSDIDMTCELSARGSEHWRLQTDSVVDGKAKSVLIVINGEKGWAKNEDRVVEAPPEAFRTRKQEFRGMRIALMLTPLKDKAIKLSPLGELKVNNRAAVGLKAVQENHPDLDIYFDKETHLLVRCELRIKESKDVEETTTTWFFSDAKAVDGVKHPMKVVLEVENKKVMELEITELKPAAKLDDNAFDKP